MRKTISLKGGVARLEEWRLAAPADFELAEGEQLAIVGPNGGGKSLLTDMLIGRHPLATGTIAYDFGADAKPMLSDNIRFIAFRDSYGASDGTYYLQQRWNQQEIDKETPLVGELLDKAYRSAGDDTPQRRAMKNRLYALFNMAPLLDKYIILLSSGELRKFQIAKALMAAPKVLVMDNPFIGLDEQMRQQVRQLMQSLAADGLLQIILVLSKSDDLPEFITHVVEVSGKRVLPKVAREAYLAARKPVPPHVLPESKRQAILDLPRSDRDYEADEVVGMSNVSIVYGQRTILKALNWTVRNGERWALSGQNGAGKSTLLSLVCADNPQSYACNITLFGNKRGSGETIWQIKKHIGYVSPEMHRAYQRDLPAIRVVASGLKDTVGLYATPTAEEYAVCKWWMDVFGLAGKESRTFLKLSSGEQRLVLLARAFVKDPELLILDEPLHGLDNVNRRLVKDVIDTFCQRPNKTMIMVTHYREEWPECINHSLQLKKNV